MLFACFGLESRLSLYESNGFLGGVYLTDANLTDVNLLANTWSDTTCPNGTRNEGVLPCTAVQLLV